MEDELAKNTKNDMWMFGLTMVIMLLYACAVSAGGDPLSTRAMVAVAGILAATLATLGSFGLLSLFGVKYVNILGALPFLVLGIGVDDMFLLMSAWSETIHKTQLTVPARVGQTFAGAGIGITITSVTDFVAFLVGTGSVFGSVTNFCLYAGVAVFFCYLCNVSLVGACLAFHGRRVYSSRHFLTCLKIRPRDVLTANGRSQCYVLCCGGSVPTKPRADESLAEKLPRLIVPKIVFNTYVRVVILLGFLGYVAAAVYGAVNLEQGLNVRDMVPPSSYFYSYLQLDNEYFPTRLPVDFIVREKIDYSGKDGDVFLNLLKQAEKDPDIVTNFSRCWLTAYRNSSFFDSASPENFVRNLQAFLSACPEFEADVVFDSSRAEVVASKCPVLSGGIKEQYDQAELMIRMRKLADDCPLPVFAYHDVFKIYEQYVHTLPATLQMVGSAVLVMTLVTFLFLPHVLLVLLVTLTIVMILVGVFGVMHFWDLSLSPITMIELIMSVGFSVDYSAHVCAAYLVSSADTREARATEAIAHAGNPSMMLHIMCL
nr:hypothetical protein BaRGS_011771 [Batillaria attramentaria]